MSVSVKTLGIDRLNIDERLALVEEIWATICVDAKAFPLTDGQRAELDRRVADDDAFPDDVVPWDEVKASVRSRLGRWRFASFFGVLREVSLRMQQSTTTNSALALARNFPSKSSRLSPELRPHRTR
jgi:putative addiction module component (TIGR02574 family)